MHTSISSPADSEFLQSSLWEQVQKTEGIVAMRFGSALFSVRIGIVRADLFTERVFPPLLFVIFFRLL